MPDYKNKKVLFITTKNLDYLRNTQEIRLLRENGEKVAVIGSKSNNYISRLFTVYGKLLFTNTAKFDICFVGFAPQLVIPLFGRKLRKKPIVEDFFISMYDTLCFDRKIFRQNGLIGRILKRIDKSTLVAADLAICDTKAHGRYFCKEFGFPAEKMSVLYLEADNSIYYPREVPKNKDFTVLYFGSVLPLQGVSVILKAIDLLKNESELRFVFIGPLGKKNKRPAQKTGPSKRQQLDNAMEGCVIS